MIYEWDIGARKNVPAQMVGITIEKIIARDGGVTPQALVNQAARANSPLHKMFEWNDKYAAVQWRKQQARGVLNSLRVIQEIDGEATAVIAFVSVTVENAHAYVTTATAMSKEEYRQEVLTDALRTLAGFQRRYNELLELQPVFAAIKQVQGAKP